MLDPKKQNELKELLEKSQNPIFFFDNDADGLCSFLLFRRWLGRGKGVAIRSYPDLDEGYAKRAEELGADAIFVLDKPVLSKAFVKAISEMNLPLIWVDHHNIQGEDFSEFSNIVSFNSSDGLKKGEASDPVTSMAYRLCGNKEDAWLAMMGCIADHHLPYFVKEFEEQYPELWSSNIKEPFDAYYGAEIGKIARSLNFGLKDSVTNVVAMQNHLISCKSPRDVLAEVSGNRTFRAKYEEVKGRYDALLSKAENELDGKMLFFSYGGETSMSADLSNELSYKHPGVYVIVAFEKGGITNLSIRGKGVKGILAEVLKNFEGASGGGHEDAVGARIQTQDTARFHEIFNREIGNGK